MQSHAFRGIHRPSTRRRRRAAWSAVVAVALAAVVSATPWPARPALAETTPATVSISSLSPAGSFSPNGDAIEDTVDVYFCLDAPANVTAVALDAAGTTVRTMVSTRSFAAGCHYGDVRWDGRADGGALAPDGTYVLRLTAMNASGQPTEATAPIVLDRRLPGVVSAPAPGSVLSGTVEFVFTPTPGMHVTRVRFDLTSPTLSCATPEVMTAAPDGTFRTSYDTTTSCGEGARTLTAYVQFVDPAGAGHSWNSTGQPVTLANPAPPAVAVVSYVPVVFSPNGDGQEDQATFNYCTADTVDGGALAVRVRIVDEHGATVRTLADEQRDPAPFCYTWYGYFSTLSWDGTNDAGDPAPDGAYQVEVAATDATGLVGTERLDVVVDRRAPGRITAPAAGATVHGPAEFAFEPAAGVEVRRVTFVLANQTVSCAAPEVTAPDGSGVFRVVFDTGADCGDGARHLTATVRYVDARGVEHGWTSAPVPLTLDNPAPPAPALQLWSGAMFSPNGDAQDDEASFSYCAADATDGGRLSTVVRVVAADGTVVRTLTQEDRDPAPFCYTWYGWFSGGTWNGLDDAGQPAPDGTYTIEVAATDGGGLTGTARASVILDRRVPGVLDAPAAQATLEGPAEFAFTPTPGFTVLQATFVLTSPTESCGSPALTEAGPDGVFRTTFDTATCGDGARNASVQVQYRNPAGEVRWWTSPPRAVTLHNPAAPVVAVRLYSSTTFSPNADGQDDTLSFAYCAADAADGGRLSVVVRVLDGTGAPVRTLHAQDADPSPACYSWYGYFYGLDWNGTDDDGQAVPDGAYTLEVSATDQTGRTGTELATLTVDRRLPGTLDLPGPGATLAGTALFEFTPAGHVSTQQVDVSVAGRGATMYNASPDGRWRTTMPMGQLPPGPATFYWTVRWTDAAGQTHYYSKQFEVAVDPTSIPLAVTATGSGGPAPLDVSFAVTASEPNGRPLQLLVNYGDGTAEVHRTVEAPYATVTLTHRYADPGAYQAFVSVSNGSGGYAAQTLPVTVAGQPNTPPQVNVATGPVTGTAPLDVSTTIEASDAEGDQLRYTTDFGDGTAPVTGTLPVAPLAHRYTVPGTYLVRTEVSDGRLSVVRTTRVTAVLSEPLQARAGDDRSVIAGDEIIFDGGGSRPAAVIGSYEWTFGDGASATGNTPRHTFSTPGTYTVTLTVRAGTLTAQDTATVRVAPVPVEPGLGVTVRSGGRAVPGAEALVILPDGQRISGIAGAGGTTRLRGLADGAVTVYAWADGYQPGTAVATVAGGSGQVEFDLVGGDVGAATLTSERLTVEEIVAKGLDPAAPENQNVYEFTVNLFFVPAEPQQEPPTHDLHIEVVTNLDGVYTLLYDAGQGPQSCDPAFCQLGWGTNVVVPQVTYVQQQPVVQWLVIPGRAKFLKEFFDVSLIVQNLAPAGFTFTQGSATLDLPGGLSLAPTAEPQHLTVDVADIPGGAGRTTTWTVRGDGEGSYDLHAAYSASLEPVGKPVRLQAATVSPLKVWGGSLLHMSVQVDSCAVRNGPYHVTIVLRNVSDPRDRDAARVYNAEVELLDRPSDAPDWQALYSLAPPTRYTTAVIEPGATMVSRFVVYPALGNDDVRHLRLIPESSFIQRTGGNVGVPSEIAVNDVGNCATLDYGAVTVGEVVPGGAGPDTATVTWTKVTPDAEVESYELLGAATLGDPLTATRFGRTPPGTTSVTLSSDQDRDLRYVTVLTHLKDGRTVADHMLAEGPPRYVALGDSFSSGEGYPGFEPSTNQCHRSLGSYSRQLSQDVAVRDLFLPAGFHACSGAVVDDSFNDNPNNPGERPQRSHVNKFTERVTLTMGGNDSGFSGLAKLCIAWDCGHDLANKLLAYSADTFNVAVNLMSVLQCAAANTTGAGLQCDVSAALQTAIHEVAARSQSINNVDSGVLRQRLVALYRDLLAAAPDAQILVGTYPQVVDESDTTCALRPDVTDALLTLSGAEKRYISAFTNRLNTTIRNATLEAGDGARLHFVDVNQPGSTFSTHKLCTAAGLNPDSAVNTLVSPMVFSVHPNAIGQHAYYEEFLKATNRTANVRRTVHGGETAAVAQVVVDPGTTLSTSVTAPGSTVELRLTAPGGTRYDRRGVPAGAEWSVTGTTETVRIPGAEAGTWQIELIGGQVDPPGTQVQVFAGTAAPAPPAGPSAVATATVLDRGARLVHVDGAGSTSPSGPITSYTWYFGDGSTATGPVADHTFAAPGTYPVGLLVTDGTGQSHTVVLPPIDLTDDAPVAAADFGTVPEDGVLTVAAPGVLANDTDTEGGPLTATLVTGPAHGTVQLAADGGYVYRPAPDFSGTDSFSYDAHDGFGTARGTVTITVTPVNDAPVAVADAYTTRQARPLVVAAPGVLANDTDVEGGPLTAALVTGPAHGTLTLAPDGSFTYTPAGGFAGVDAFQYRAADPAATSPAVTVQLTVTGCADDFGYTCATAARAFTPADTTVLPLSGDDATTQVALPFPVTLYGQTYATAWVDTNGIVSLVNPGGPHADNGTLPTGTLPNAAVYAFWTDLVVDASASVRTAVSGTAPNRQFIVEWRNVYLYGNTSRRLTFEAILTESGDVITNYTGLDNDFERGSVATVGIENADGSDALTYSVNTAGLQSATAVVFTAPGGTPPPATTGSISGTVTVSGGGAVPAATVTLTPGGLSATTSATGTYTFTGLGNGTYTVATAHDGRSTSVSVVVSDGGPATADLVLPVATGSYAVSTLPAAFAPADGTVLPLTGDDAVLQITLPAPVTLYGAQYTTAWVDTNGKVSFTNPGTAYVEHGPLPSTAPPNATVYPFWCDLVVDGQASVRTAAAGGAFTVEWRNVHLYGNTSRRLSFSVVFASDGTITLHYQSLDNAAERGSGATVGLENSTGTLAALYSYNDATLVAGTAIRFTPS
ncbi:PKD domain-containing protein [Dactylosporangium sp. NPDC005572]|uniref:PKD domain-containing protein n=1 Tax=Dactylosporangium sp. NPDC005572 TaxID=3156889 RepID=UPI0033A61726